MKKDIIRFLTAIIPLIVALIGFVDSQITKKPNEANQIIVIQQCQNCTFKQ